MKLNRRHLLASIPALLASAKAHALSLDESNFALSELVANRCGKTGNHMRLLAETDRILADAGYSEADRKTVLATLNCPTCGCPLETPAN